MSTENILDSRILIVDDEMGSRESMKFLLNNVYQVLTAEDGQRCLELIQKDRINLIILDINMPEMHGFEVLRRVKETDYSIPVIIVTGIREHQTIVDALRLGASDFILKPFETAYLRQTVKETLIQADLEKDNKEREKIKSNLLPLEEISREEYYNILDILHRILESKEPFAKGHSTRVTRYVVAIAGELGFPAEQIKTMERTSLLHDIGKIGINDKIITKFGKFTPEEYQEIKRHPEIGTRLLDPLRLSHIDYTMILHHHESYNGKGYPKGMVGEEIPIYARILAVADAFDAMISDRSYRNRLTIDQAKGELIEMTGVQFDPHITEAFIKILEKNPLIVGE